VIIGIIMYAVVIGTTRGLVGIPTQIRSWWQRRQMHRARGEPEPEATPAELKIPGL
jgi:hypothetical protein